MSDRRLRLGAGRIVKDLAVGDCVRLKGHRGIGFIECFDDKGDAWVTWRWGRKLKHPLVMLRRVRAGGHEYDSRRWIP